MSIFILTFDDIVLDEGEDMSKAIIGVYDTLEAAETALEEMLAARVAEEIDLYGPDAGDFFDEFRPYFFIRKMKLNNTNKKFFEV